MGDPRLTPEQNAKLAELRLIHSAAYEADRQREQFEKDNLLYVTPKTPNPKQKLMLDAWLNPYYKTFTYTGGNRSAKTTTGIWILLATLFGSYVWNPEVPLPVDIGRPRKIRLVGQDWEKHINTVLVPKLEEWWPKSRPMKRKKNTHGIYAMWEDTTTKSTLEIMSNKQDSELFEGWDGDCVFYDEPPKRAVRVACARGLVDREGREYFGMTLLKEAWIDREVLKARNEDGTVDTTVFKVEASIYDNLGFGVTMEGIKQFEKSLTEAEKHARLYGKPAHLSALVWPQFDPQMHVIPRFDVPLDWLVDINIDFHPAKPWAVEFLATDKLGFKYVVEEIKETGSPKSIVDKIVRLIRSKFYRVESAIQIDPLAKGDTNSEKSVFTTMWEAFASYGYSLTTASKNKETGIPTVGEYLITENEMPALFFFADCVNHINEVENYMFDPDTGKPAKEDDDFCETLYRNIVRGTVWYPVQEVDEFDLGTGYTGNSESQAGY